MIKKKCEFSLGVREILGLHLLSDHSKQTCILARPLQ